MPDQPYAQLFDWHRRSESRSEAAERNPHRDPARTHGDADAQPRGHRDQIDHEIKAVLRDQLGAELVEAITPGYPDDPDVPNLTYTFADALSELLPRLMPEIFKRRDARATCCSRCPATTSPRMTT